MTADGAPVRPAALSLGGMVTSNSGAVSSVGASVLGHGGNAVDASLAMAAMCWLVLPGQCGVAGDAFAVIREPDGRVWTVGASGYGPDGGEPDFYRAQGLRSVPLHGALAVAAGGTMATVAALHASGGSRSLSQLWRPALRSARDGVPCSPKMRADILDCEASLRQDPGLSKVFLRRGIAPQIGERIVYTDLASTIERLAGDPRAMYRGELAQRIVAALVDGGAPFSGSEWEASGQAEVAPAISHRYGPTVVHVSRPPSPGWMVLQQAAICDGVLAERDWLGAGAIDLLAQAARRAFTDRYLRCNSDNGAWRELLEPEAVATARRGLDRDRLSMTGVTGAGDTTSTVAVDSDGRAVTFIQSLALTFGAHFSAGDTGVALSNRLGRGAYLIDGHPNQVAPRRRPMSTLNAWIATDEAGGLLGAGNTPGGDGQVQWNMQVLSHLYDHGLDPQEAVSAPRFCVFPGSDAHTIDAPDELVCESRIDQAVIGELTGRGHRVRVVGPWEGGGGAMAICLDTRLGCLAGGVDPRQDGVALGA